jgi:hypothetical protein
MSIPPVLTRFPQLVTSLVAARRPELVEKLCKHFLSKSSASPTDIFPHSPPLSSPLHPANHARISPRPLKSSLSNTRPPRHLHRRQHHRYLSRHTPQQSLSSTIHQTSDRNYQARIVLPSMHEPCVSSGMERGCRQVAVPGIHLVRQRRLHGLRR